MAYLAKISYMQDASISSPSTGQILRWDGSAWVNASISGLGLYSLTVDDFALKMDSGTTYNPGSAARTISHATTAGYKHLPSGSTSTMWLKNSGADGVGAWTAPAALSLATDHGLSMAGAYDINTARTIALGTPSTITSTSTNSVTTTTHTHAIGTGIVVSTTGTDKKIAYFTGTSAITCEATFGYDYGTDLMTVGHITTTGNIIVGGDLTVNGTTTTMNVSTYAVEDPLVKYALNNINDTVDIGFYGTYDTSGTAKYRGVTWDASEGHWAFWTANQSEPTTTIDTGGTGYTKAKISIGAATSVDDNYLVWDATTGLVSYRTRANIVDGTGSANTVAIWSDADSITYDSGFTYTSNWLSVENFTNTGGVRWNKVVDKVSAYTLTVNDFIVTTSGAGSFAVTIPTAAFSFVGQAWYVKTNGTGTITVDTEGSETIDGAASYTFPGQYTAVLIVIVSASTAIIL